MDILTYHHFSSISNIINPALVIVDLSENSLVLLDQVLHTDQVTAAVGRGSNRLLLTDPRLLIFDVTEKLLNDQRLPQTVPAVLHRRDEGVVAARQRRGLSCWQKKKCMRLNNELLFHQFEIINGHLPFFEK